MGKKELQEERMKGFFISATKEIIKGEGIRALSVRNIADRAGYSYATLYNYFKDMKDLIFICIKDFQEECRLYIESEVKNFSKGKDKLKAKTKAFMKYFVQYPGIFELFYIERFNDIANKTTSIEMICTFLDCLTDDDWNYCVSTKMLSTENAGNLKEELRFVTAGMLLFYLNRRFPASYKDFINMTDAKLNSILNF
ncbi:MAG TPA: TetR/AcrR family transcriptional regulator [Candidatus Kapabacteria bacterium]|nr:TetR/AcrR family transcriptional regulator [Candidatus Kapabacteria bacterium]HPO62791.1 TetR/AcrR family transcriptional regulator [Candidatus Kapabacteria bacterium]